MMTDEERHLRATLVGESLLSASLQSQRNSYAQRSVSSVNRIFDDIPSEDLIAGARRGSKVSNVRRFFCLLVTFDLFFTALVWLICTMIAGESIESAFENQVVHYKFSTSLFDIVMAALCRFTILILFYALLHLDHRSIVALTTMLSCAFLIAKVAYFDWPQNSQPAFPGFLIITSFTLAWGEAWFFDFRVIPQETTAREWILASSMDPERAPLLHQLLDDQMGRVENPGNFFTPMDSPNNSDTENESNEIGISAGSIEEQSSDFLPTIPRLSTRMDVSFLRNFLFGAIEITRDCIEKDWSMNDISLYHESVESPKKSSIEEYKNKAVDLVDRSYKLLTSKDWTELKTTTCGDKISVMNWKHEKILKIEGYIDAPAAELLDLLYENVEQTQTWNMHVMDTKRIPIDQNTDIIYQTTKSHGGGIIGPRDFVTLRQRGSFGNYNIISGVSVHCNEIPMRKNFVRGENGLVCWATEKTSTTNDGVPGVCRFTWILNTNLKGWVPRKVIETSLTIALTEFMGFLRSHVRDLTDVTA